MSTTLSWHDRVLDFIFPYRAPAREIHEAVTARSALVASAVELAQSLPQLRLIRYGVIQQWHGTHWWLTPLPLRTYWSSGITECPICHAPGCMQHVTITPLPDGVVASEPAGRALTAEEYAAIKAQATGVPVSQRAS